MFPHFIFLVVSSVSFLRSFHVSGCDYNCAVKPVFTPSSLVVRFGDSTSANCSVCEPACVRALDGVESPVGETKNINSTISWTVDALTQWSVSSLCFYTDDTGHQCCTKLPVTVYKPPHNVSISVVNHRGPMLEGHQYTLQCTVEGVAPVKDLSVTFYRGHTALGPPLSINSTEEKPVNQNFTLDISPGGEDDGAEYWCGTKLDLGPEGPKRPPVETSQTITATVHYRPHLEAPTHPDPVRVREGELLRLNCSAVANPPPLYTWTKASQKIKVSDNVLTINSTAVSDTGKYTCSAVNSMGDVTREFDVEVQGVELTTTTPSAPPTTTTPLFTTTTTPSAPPTTTTPLFTTTTPPSTTTTTTTPPSTTTRSPNSAPSCSGPMLRSFFVCFMLLFSALV